MCGRERRITKAGELVLGVKDTGIGMSEEQLKEALEPFRQVTSSTQGRSGKERASGFR